MKTYAFAAAMVLASAAAANAFSISVHFGADGENAVICSVSEVTLLAESADDCTKAGGTVTHEVTPVAQ